MQSLEFVKQIEEIETVGIGYVISGRLLFTKQCILHEPTGRLDSMTVKKTCSNGIEVE